MSLDHLSSVLPLITLMLLLLINCFNHGFQLAIDNLVNFLKMGFIFWSYFRKYSWLLLFNWFGSVVADGVGDQTVSWCIWGSELFRYWSQLCFDSCVWVKYAKPIQILEDPPVLFLHGCLVLGDGPSFMDQWRCASTLSFFTRWTNWPNHFLFCHFFLVHIFKMSLAAWRHKSRGQSLWLFNLVDMMIFSSGSFWPRWALLNTLWKARLGKRPGRC